MVDFFVVLLKGKSNTVRLGKAHKYKGPPQKRIFTKRIRKSQLGLKLDYLFGSYLTLTCLHTLVP